MSTIEAMVAKAFKKFLEGGTFDKMLSKTLGGDDANENEEQKEKQEAKPTRSCICCGNPKHSKADCPHKLRPRTRELWKERTHETGQ